MSVPRGLSFVRPLVKVTLSQWSQRLEENNPSSWELTSNMVKMAMGVQTCDQPEMQRISARTEMQRITNALVISRTIETRSNKWVIKPAWWWSGSAESAAGLNSFFSTYRRILGISQAASTVMATFPLSSMYLVANRLQALAGWKVAWRLRKPEHKTSQRGRR